MTDTPELVDENEASVLLAVSVRSLQTWRVSGGGPDYVKLGRAVRYRRSDLLAWIAANTRRSTSATSSQVRA